VNRAVVPLCKLLALERPDDFPVCVDTNGRRITWHAFLGDVGRYRHLLEEGNSERWAICCRDSYRFSAALFAALHAGRTPVLLPNFQQGTVELLRDVYDAIISDEPRLPGIHIDDGEASPRSPHDFHELDPNLAGITIFTSGSTGQPKNVDKRLQQFEAEIQGLENLWGQELGDATVLSSVSHQHIYGLLFRLLWPLSAGRCFLRNDLAYPEETLGAIRKHRNCVFVSSPALLKRMSQETHMPEHPHTPVMIFSSGGLLPTEAAQRCHADLGTWPTEVLGSTETGGIGWRRQQPENKGYWTRFSCVRLNLSESGQLVVQSPYLGQEGSFVTGDRARLVDDRHFTLLGRADRVVKIEEKRVSLPELENRLNQCELVDTNAMVYMDNKTRQSIACVVVLSTAGKKILDDHGKPPVTEQLRAHLKRYFDLIVVPRRFRFVDELPYNSQGKLLFSDLKALFEELPTEPLVDSINRDGHSLAATLRIPADLLYLRGHFPVAAVLPGVVQVDWAIRLGRKYLDLSGHFMKMENIKFKKVIRPDALLQLSLAATMTQEGSKLYFEFRSEKGMHSCGRIFFGSGHES